MVPHSLKSEGLSCLWIQCLTYTYARSPCCRYDASYCIDMHVSLASLDVMLTYKSVPRISIGSMDIQLHPTEYYWK